MDEPLTKSVIIGIGSNIEPRVRAVLSALHLLSKCDGIRVERVSSVYLSEAHTLDNIAQPDYLNAAAVLRTALSPFALLERCIQIERSLGRVRDNEGRWKPRRIDLDILLHSDGRVDSTTLKIPHPRMRERLFVLRPLADLVPAGHVFAELGATIGDLLHECRDGGRITRTIIDLSNYK